MKKLTAVLLLCLALPVFPSVSSAECPCKGRSSQDDPACCPRVNLMLSHRKDLQLTGEQASRLTELQDKLIRDNSAILAEAKTLEKQLNVMMDTANPDFNAVKDQMTKISDLRLKAGTAKVDCYSAGYGLLSDQQKQQFNELWKKSEKKKKK